MYVREIAGYIGLIEAYVIGRRMHDLSITID